jgi:hypothetical protein
MLVTFEGYATDAIDGKFTGEVKAMNGVEKKERPHPLVEVIRLPPKLIERLALFQELLQSQPVADGSEGSVADRRIPARDDVQEL